MFPAAAAPECPGRVQSKTPPESPMKTSVRGNSLALFLILMVPAAVGRSRADSLPVTGTLPVPAEAGPAPAILPCGRLEHPGLEECSGLVASRRSPGVFWALSDNGVMVAGLSMRFSPVGISGRVTPR